MDNAVALVQAYLRVNGYFTVSEYPVVERIRAGGIRTVTDLDILAFRFPGAGRLLVRKGSAVTEASRIETDPALAAPPEHADMLIGEVKEGAADLNRAARDPGVLEVVLARFGCCSADSAGGMVKQLMQAGRVRAPSGHNVRLVAFGTAAAVSQENGFLVIPLAHVISFLRQHVREHWDVLRHVQPKDTAFGFLTLFEKARSISRR